MINLWISVLRGLFIIFTQRTSCTLSHLTKGPTLTKIALVL